MSSERPNDSEIQMNKNICYQTTDSDNDPCSSSGSPHTDQGSCGVDSTVSDSQHTSSGVLETLRTCGVMFSATDTSSKSMIIILQ